MKNLTSLLVKENKRKLADFKKGLSELKDTYSIQNTHFYTRFLTPAILNKNLSKYKKLELIQDLNFVSCERHSVAIYLNALRTDNTKIIEEYEAFGDTMRTMLMNKREYDQNKKFGFNNIVFNEYGWLERPKLLNLEEIEFKAGKELHAQNKARIGQAKTGEWFYGHSWGLGNGGSLSAPCVWSKFKSTRIEALIASIEIIIKAHKDDEGSSDYKESYSKSIVKQCQNKIQELLNGTIFTQENIIQEIYSPGHQYQLF